MNKLLLVGVGLVIVVVAFVLISGNKPKQPEQQLVTPAQQQVREIKISGDEYSFSPSSISLKSGEKVRVVFENTGSLPHNVTITELGFTTDTISGGKTTTAELVPSKSGNFTMFCSVGDHRELGMVGELKIE